MSIDKGHGALAKIGINTFLWTTNLEKENFEILARIKRLGFDVVQIPLLSLDFLDPSELARSLNQFQLEVYISAGLKEHNDVTSDNPEIRRRGIEYLKGCARFAQEVGAPFLSGSFHSVFGKKPQHPVGQKEWQNSAECLKEVARENPNYCLVLEPINRYESFLVNSADQAEKLIAMIGEPNVKIQLDTFHMNIEENDFYNTIKTTGDKLVHLHVAENHRGRFGRGIIPWDDVFKALVEIDYNGAIVIESFVPEVTEVATAAAIWRKMAPSADALAKEGLEFIKALTDEYNL